MFAPAVGVMIDTRTPLSALAVGVTTGEGSPFLSPFVGVVLGPQLSEVTPTTLSRGASHHLAITGFNLGAVNAIEGDPAAGLDFGEIGVNPEGTQITVEVTVDTSATTGERGLLIETPDGPVATRNGGRLRVTIE